MTTMERYFRTSVHALAMTSFLAVAVTGRLDAISIALYSMLLAWSLYRTLGNRPPALRARAVLMLSCGYIAYFFLDSTVISGSFIPATIHLILFLELVKLYQEKTDRDYFYIIVLSFLNILAASSLTIDMMFTVTLFLFLIALVSTLMSFEMFRAERGGRSRTVLKSLPIVGMSFWATLWIGLVGIGLFLVIPRVGTGYFSRVATTSLLLSGFSENVQLGEIGQVKLSPAVVMHTRRVSGTRFAVLKWRGIALDTFDGDRWYRADRRRDRLANIADGTFTIHPFNNTGEHAEYEILLEPLATNALFAPARIRSITGRLAGLETDDGDAIYGRSPSSSRTQYRVVSEIPSRPRAKAAPPEKEPEIDPQIRSQYLSLPPDLDPRVEALAREIVGNAQSTLEKASRVESYLRRAYKYTLQLTWKPGPQPISTFLFDAKAGHCEYFASSMAILLRTVGVPTRLVNGFLMGEYNPIGDDYIVRQSDAHSWVEVYLPGSGEWLEFDPTPPDPGQHENGITAQISHYVDAAELYWNSYIIVYDSSVQLQLFRNAQDKAQNLRSEFRLRSGRWMDSGQRFADIVSAPIERMLNRPAFWILGGSGMIFALGYRSRKFWLTRIEIRRVRKGAGTVSSNVVEQMFYRAAKLAQRGSARRGPGETWREWVVKLQNPASRASLTRALEVFEKSKYGRLPTSASDFAMLEETIRELKA